MPTKDDFLDAWEGPCVKAAAEAIQRELVCERCGSSQSLLVSKKWAEVVVRAIAPKLMEGLEQVHWSVESSQFDDHDTFILALPKEQ